MIVPAAAGCSGAGRSEGAEPATFQVLGEEVYARGEIDSARTLFQAARGTSEESGDSIGLARSLSWLAQANWRLGDYAATREMGEEGLALKLRLGLEEELFRSYNVLGLLAWNESRLLDASDLFTEATKVALATGDSANLAKVSNNLALVRTSLGDFEEAERGFLAAREMAHAVGDPLIEGRVLINLGMLAIEVGDPLTALDWLQEARPLLRAAEDPVGEQSALGHLGVAHAAIGESGRAIACLDSALHQSRARGFRQDEASNLEQLAELHRQAGNHTRALQLFEEARVINAELGLSDELASDLANKAQIRASLGNLALALDDAAEALRIHREIGSPLREVEDLVVLAELSLEAGRPEDVEPYVQDARELAAVLSVRTARLPLALGRARLALGEGDAREVLRILDQAKPDIDEGGYDAEWEAHALRARAYASMGDPASAAAEGQLAVEAVERVRESYASGILRDSYLRERADTYSDLVRALLQMGRTEEAFQVADAARGRALIEKLSSGGSSGSGGPGRGAKGSELPGVDTGAIRGLVEGDHLLRRIEELTRTLRDLDEVGLEVRSEEYEMQAEELAGELRRLRADYAAALVRAEEHDPEGAALLGGGRPGVDRIRASLGADEALLEYLVMEEAVGLFVLTRMGIRYFETETARRGLASRIRIARGALKERGPGWASGLAVLEGLHAILLGAAERDHALSGIQRLIVVPHGELDYLPFSVLRGKDKSRFLVEDFLISYLPTAGALPALRGGTPEQGMRIEEADDIGEMAVAAFAPFPADLPGTALEIDAIRKTFEDGRFVEGREATEEGFREGLRSARVVHAATHGVMNAQNPLFSRIELASGPDRSEGPGAGPAPSPENDGRLEVHELLGAAVGSSLVFLSGCETGMGPGWSTGFGRGEEFATLGQAFLYAGAKNVIATLWRIDDPGAAAFAGMFYSELSRPRSAVEALAHAQRALIRDPRYGAPYYWAAYRVTGGGDAGLLTAQAQDPDGMSVRR